MERDRLVSSSPAGEPDAGPGRRPGRPRSEEAHAAILRAAIDLIRDVGYDAVTMEGIAARAGVGKATVYRRWSSREALVVDSIQLVVAAIPATSTGTTGGDLLMLMNFALGMYRDPATGELLSGLVAAMARSEPIARAVRAGFVGTWSDAVRRVLAQGVARGDLRADLDADLALDLLAGPMFYRFLIGGGPVDERLTQGVVDAVLRALAPPHPPSPDTETHPAAGTSPAAPDATTQSKGGRAP